MLVFRRRIGRRSLYETAILFESGSSLFQLLDRPVVLVPQLGDRVGFPEDVRDLVDLRHEGCPELVKDHGGSF